MKHWRTLEPEIDIYLLRTGFDLIVKVVPRMGQSLGREHIENHILNEAYNCLLKCLWKSLRT